MAFSDEINSCTPPSGYPTGPRTRGRVQNFCDAINAEATLNVAGAGTFLSTLNVAGPATFTILTATAGSFATLTLGGALLPPPTGAGVPPARGRAAGATAASSSADGDLLVKNLVHAGGELRIGEGYYVSFKKSTSLNQSTPYVLPPSFPTTNGQVLSALTNGTMEWVDGGGGFVDPTTTQGDLLVRGATEVERLAIGTPGYVLSVAPSGTEVQWAPASGGGGGTASVFIGSNPPASPSTGDMWWDDDDGRLFLYYFDGDSSQWVDASPQGANVVSVNSQTGVVVLDADDIDDSSTNHKFVSTSQLASIGTALQPGDDVSQLVNNANYITLAQSQAGAPVLSVNSLTGTVVLDADDISDSATTHKFATQAQLNSIASATQPGDNVSTLTNDAGYITSATAPVQSVAGKTGVVTLVKGDVGLGNVDNTSDLSKPISTATQTALNAKATAAQGALADSATQPGDNVSTLTNDAGYITSAQAPIQQLVAGANISLSPASGLGVVTITGTGGGAGVSSITAGSGISVNQSTGNVIITNTGGSGGASISVGPNPPSSPSVGDLWWNDDDGRLFVYYTDSNSSQWVDASPQGATVVSVNAQTGTVVLDADDIDDSSTSHKFVSVSELASIGTALQPGDNVSQLANNANYVTLAQSQAGAPVLSVNSLTGSVVLDADDINDSSTTHKFATAAQLALVSSSVQPGDNVSSLTNDAGFVTASTAPVTSVNTQTGAVTLSADDISDSATTNKFVTAAEKTSIGTALQPGDNISTLANNSGYITDVSNDDVEDLADVTVTSVQVGDILAWSGSAWVNGAAPPADISGSSINALNDVDTSTNPPSNGNVLSWDAANGEWVPGSAGQTPPVDSVNSKTGVVVLDADDIDDSTTTHKFATAAQLSAAGSALQPGDNITELTNNAGFVTTSGNTTIGTSSNISVSGASVIRDLNLTQGVVVSFSTGSLTLADLGYTGATDANKITNNNQIANGAGYITAAQVPADAVSSVNTQTGAVVLDADDISDTGTVNKFVDSAQIGLIASATQPGDNISTLTNDSGYITAAQVPADAVSSVNSKTGAVVLDTDDVSSSGATNKYVTAAEKTSIGTATQPGDNISTLNNNSGYITLSQSQTGAPVQSVNSQTGSVVLDADDIDDSSTTHKFATASQLSLANSSVQPGDNISTLTNNANYITSAGAPVQSVAGKTGSVSLVKGDVGLGNVDNTSDLSKPISTATQNALNVKADLVGGKVPTSQLPALAVTEYLGTAANQSAMLALSGERGDWCIRTDLSSTFVLVSDGGSSLSDWQELATPASPVSSVNGQTGAVVLGASDVGAATTAQGTTADSATQPGDNISTLNNDSGYITAAQVPADAVSSVNTQTGAVVLGASDVGAATTAQGSKADSAVQPGDNVSDLTNDANYITLAQVPADAVSSVNSKTGSVVLDTDDISSSGATNKYVTAAEKTSIGTATQPGDNITTLTNNANYITLAQVPADAVSSVNSQTGSVVLDADDISDSSTTNKFATQAQLNSIASAIQPGDNVSTLTNDAGYITNAGVTQIVAGSNVTISPTSGTGAVTINSTGGGGGGGGTTKADIYGTAKAWGTVNSDGTQGYVGSNFASSTRTAQGSYTITFATPLASNDYVVEVTPEDQYSASGVKNKTTTGFDLLNVDVSASPSTPRDTKFDFVVFDSEPAEIIVGSGTVANTNLYGTAKAWGSFNALGSTLSATNLSATSPSAGIYFVSFGTAMADNKYTVVATSSYNPNNVVTDCITANKTTTGFTVYVNQSGSGASQYNNFDVVVYDDEPAEVALTTFGDVINYGGAAAWATVDETTSNGPCTVPNSLNISSVTRTAKGFYDVVFTTAMPSSEYAVTSAPNSDNLSGTAENRVASYENRTASGFTIRVTGANNLRDCGFAFSVDALNALPPKGGTGTDAWGEFSSIGTLGGTFNIASVTNSATGRYDVTFTTAMPNASYAVNATTGLTTCKASVFSKTSTGFSIYVVDTSGSSHFNSNCACNFTVNATNATLPNSFSEEEIQSVVDLAQSGATNPGASAWALTDNSGSLISGLNIASVTRSASGKYDYVFATSMPSADYSLSGSVTDATGSATNGSINFSNLTAAGFTVTTKDGSNSTTNRPHSLQVFATNALPPKGGTGTDAWGTYDASRNLLGGFNIQSITTAGGSGLTDVVFTTPMPTANYSVTCSADVGASAYVSPVNKTVNGFRITVRRSLDGAVLNAAVNFQVNATNAKLPTSFTEAQIQSVVDLAQNPQGIAKAWVKYNGNTQTVLSSYNVSSVTRTATGAYTVYFANSFSSGDYCVQVSSIRQNTLAVGDYAEVVSASSPLPGQCSVLSSVATTSSGVPAMDTVFYMTVFAL